MSRYAVVARQSRICTGGGGGQIDPPTLSWLWAKQNIDFNHIRLYAN